MVRYGKIPPAAADNHDEIAGKAIGFATRCAYLLNISSSVYHALVHCLLQTESSIDMVWLRHGRKYLERY